MNTSIIRCSDIAAYRSWTTRTSGPAYMRGLATWVWKSALAGCQPTPPAAGT